MMPSGCESTSNSDAAGGKQSKKLVLNMFKAALIHVFMTNQSLSVKCSPPPKTENRQNGQLVW